MKKIKLLFHPALVIILLGGIMLFSCSKTSQDVSPSQATSKKNNKNASTIGLANTIADSPLYDSYIQAYEADYSMRVQKIASIEVGTSLESLITSFQNLLAQKNYDGVVQGIGYANYTAYLQTATSIAQKYQALLAEYPNFENVSEDVYDAYTVKRGGAGRLNAL